MASLRLPKGFALADGGVTAARGFQAAGIHCGIKRAGPDLGLICSTREAAVAGLFTTNQVVAAPVVLSRQRARGGRARAIIVNSGCANACTGAAGMADAREMGALAAAALGVPPSQVLVASTGVIGERLPMARLREGIPEAAAALARDTSRVARAIMTTDTRPKICAVKHCRRGYAIGGVAKGAGMIAPTMATLLAFLTTDAAVETRALRAALAEAVDASFNAITVDGDTSTNDTVVLLANGALGPVAPEVVTSRIVRGRFRELGLPDSSTDQARRAIRRGLRARAARRPREIVHRRFAGRGSAAYREFVAGLTFVAQRLALEIVRDGEGATRLVQVSVRGARRVDDARRIARTVAESPLVKTAINGGDPNWGRVVAAVGRAGVPVRSDRITVTIGRTPVFRSGAGVRGAEAAAHRALLRKEVDLIIDLGLGRAGATLWTCDLSEGYVQINAHYRT